MVNSFKEYVELRKSQQYDEIFGLFSSPWDQIIDSNPNYQHISSKLDKNVLSQLRKIIIQELQSSGNQPQNASHIPAINSIIQSWCTKILVGLKGQSKPNPLQTQKLGKIQPMSNSQATSFDKNFGRL